MYLFIVPFFFPCFRFHSFQRFFIPVFFSHALARDTTNGRGGHRTRGPQDYRTKGPQHNGPQTAQRTTRPQDQRHLNVVSKGFIFSRKRDFFHGMHLFFNVIPVFAMRSEIQMSSFKNGDTKSWLSRKVGQGRFQDVLTAPFATPCVLWFCLASFAGHIIRKGWHTCNAQYGYQVYPSYTFMRDI